MFRLRIAKISYVLFEWNLSEILTLLSRFPSNIPQFYFSVKSYSVDPAELFILLDTCENRTRPVILTVETKSSVFFCEEFDHTLANARPTNIPFLVSGCNAIWKQMEPEAVPVNATSVAKFLRSLYLHNKEDYTHLALKLSFLSNFAFGCLPFDRGLLEYDFRLNQLSVPAFTHWVFTQRSRLLRLLLCLARCCSIWGRHLPLEIVATDILPFVSLTYFGKRYNTRSSKRVNARTQLSA
jgi:hypothetical protein